MMGIIHARREAMSEKLTLKERLDPKKHADKAWYLALLDQEAQFAY